LERRSRSVSSILAPSHVMISYFHFPQKLIWADSSGVSVVVIALDVALMPESVSFGSAIYCLLLHLWLNYEISYEMGDPNCIGFCRSGQKAWRNQPFFSGSSRSRTKKNSTCGGKDRPHGIITKERRPFSHRPRKPPNPCPIRTQCP